jgi:hypothetical protein
MENINKVRSSFYHGYQWHDPNPERRVPPAPNARPGIITNPLVPFIHLVSSCPRDKNDELAYMKKGGNWKRLHVLYEFAKFNANHGSTTTNVPYTGDCNITPHR